MLRGCVLAAVVLAASPAHAYEFWLSAHTIGQAYQLRDYQLLGPDLFLDRRIVTQTLALRIFDLGDLSARRRRARLPDQGLRISWLSYLRIDHDFGDYTSGRILLPGPVPRDALDVIPELADSVASLQLLYGYLELDGIADDRLRLQVGRVPFDDGWATSAFDGAAARYVVAAPLVVSASAGLRVRASSPLGVSSYELDGTSGAGCQEYVEGPTPGSGSWQLIDRNRAITNNALSSDYADCPQRDVAQPTIAVSVATAKVHGFGAEIGYRRTWSETVGLIGSVNRLQYPDLGLYPNDYGQAPATGVNEDRVYARVHGEVQSGAWRIAPYGDARYSILDGLVDRADAGVRLSHGAHELEPAVEYFYPTFDGDSIFNAFSIDPTTDARLGYRYAHGTWRGTADAWLRHYGHEDGQPALAGGVDAGVEHALGGAWQARLDALWDDGWGGRRIGGTAQAAWRQAQTFWLRGRVIVLGVRDDGTQLSTLPHDYVTSSTVVSTTWRVADAVAIDAIAEADYDAVQGLQTRVIGVLDLAFAPEP
jgi:hypothetical protein